MAVLRLISNLNLVGCWTGRSTVFAPLRIGPNMLGADAPCNDPAGGVAHQASANHVRRIRIDCRDFVEVRQLQYFIRLVVDSRKITNDERPSFAFGNRCEGHVQGIG